MECEREGCSHKATLTFSAEPMFALTHGFGQEICLCCYIKEIEEHLEDIQNNLKKQKAKLKKDGCE